MVEALSDELVLQRFADRRRRQYRVFWIGFPSALVCTAASAVVFALIVSSHPDLNSPLLMVVLTAPYWVGFAFVAARFTRANLRCPTCDVAISLQGWPRYYNRVFDCPHCRRALSR